jgi:hypothetical protein
VLSVVCFFLLSPLGFPLFLARLFNPPPEPLASNRRSPLLRLVEKTSPARPRRLSSLPTVRHLQLRFLWFAQQGNPERDRPERAGGDRREHVELSGGVRGLCKGRDELGRREPGQVQVALGEGHQGERRAGLSGIGPAASTSQSLFLSRRDLTRPTLVHSETLATLPRRPDLPSDRHLLPILPEQLHRLPSALVSRAEPPGSSGCTARRR